MSSARHRTKAMALCLFFVTVPRTAPAVEPTQSCATGYAKGQDDRLAGRLFDARTAFKRCADAACPAALAADCARWASEVEADLPTVKLGATDTRGRDVAHLRVLADGAAIPSAELTRPVVLEAGPHTLRFEAPGFEPVEVPTALRPTDRELDVRATLYAVGEARSHPNAGVVAPEHATPKLSLVLAGVGVVALGTSVYFGSSARNRYDELEERCAPRCPQADADSVASKALVADVALAASVVALGAAAWIYFGTDAQPKAAVVLSSRRGGGSAGVSVTF